MRWKTKYKKSKIALGSHRSSFKFAWVPIKTTDNNTVWLEKYLVIQRYSDYIMHWRPLRWVDLGRYSQESPTWKEYYEKV